MVLKSYFWSQSSHLDICPSGYCKFHNPVKKIWSVNDKLVPQEVGVEVRAARAQQQQIVCIMSCITVPLVY